MKKKLHADAITNELEASAFFAHKKAQQKHGKPEPVPAPSPRNEVAHENHTVTPVRTNVRTGVRRTITRYAFEFFQDQIESLRKMSLEEKQRGEKGSMSEMVREAIDMYIAKRNNTDV